MALMQRDWIANPSGLACSSSLQGVLIPGSQLEVNMVDQTGLSIRYCLSAGNLSIRVDWADTTLGPAPDNAYATMFTVGLPNSGPNQMQWSGFFPLTSAQIAAAGDITLRAYLVGIGGSTLYYLDLMMV